MVLNKELVKKIRKLNVATHRDLGYFFSSLIIIYCISGLALNHVNDWNADFIIKKNTVHIDRSYTKSEVTGNVITAIGKTIGEEKYKVYDFPTDDQVKIYYDNASLHLNLNTRIGIYEKITRRQVFFQSNLLHRNSIKGWKYIADVFAVMLIVLSVTGLFILKGKKGINGRGKWWIAAGLLPPLIAIIIYQCS